MSMSMTRIATIAAAALLAGTPVALPSAVLAQDQAVTQTVAIGSAPRLINLPRGTSFAVDLPADARAVIVSNPAVAEANVHSPRRITVIGIAPDSILVASFGVSARSTNPLMSVLAPGPADEASALLAMTI